MDKLDAARSGRLRRAAIDGLARHLRSVEQALAAFPDPVPPARLLEAAARARQVLSAAPLVRPGAYRRQLGLRLAYAARRALTSPFRRSAGT